MQPDAAFPEHSLANIFFWRGNTGGITQPPSSASDVVDYYDDGLTRGTLTSLSSISYNLSATQISNYAMFGGGYGGGNMLNAYDSKLTRTVGTPLSASRYYLSSGTLDNHAFFGGGFSAIDVVDTYNTELTKTQLSPLSIGRYGIAVASTNSYILFLVAWKEVRNIRLLMCMIQN